MEAGARRGPPLASYQLALAIGCERWRSSGPINLVSSFAGAHLLSSFVVVVVVVGLARHGHRARAVSQDDAAAKSHWATIGALGWHCIERLMRV